MVLQGLSHGDSYESVDEGNKSGSVSRQDSLKLPPLRSRTKSFSHSKSPYAFEPSSPGMVIINKETGLEACKVYTPIVTPFGLGLTTSAAGL